MWKWYSELHELGFRRRSERYWQCERGYQLPSHCYLSLFVDSLDGGPRGPLRIEFASFHVTFRVGVDRLHVYYHEVEDSVWETGGYTSLAELQRLGLTRDDLLREADRIAREVLAELGAILTPRGTGTER